MKKQLIEINLFSDPIRRKSGVNSTFGMPTFEEKEAEQEIAELKIIVKSACEKVMHIFDTYTIATVEQDQCEGCNGCDDKPSRSDIEESIEKAIILGEMAVVLKEMGKGLVNDKELEEFESAIKLAKLAKLSKAALNKMK